MPLRERVEGAVALGGLLQGRQRVSSLRRSGLLGGRATIL